MKKPWRPVIVGLDLSLNGTGICVSGGTVSKSGDYVGRSKSEGILHLDGYIFREVVHKGASSRFQKWTRICEAVIAYTFEADEIYIEDYAYGTRGSATTVLAEVGGIVRYHLARAGLHYRVVGPQTLKKFVTGKGNVKKDIVLKEIYRRWGMNLNSNNLGDAFGLAKLGEALAGIEKITKDQLKLLQANVREEL